MRYPDLPKPKRIPAAHVAGAVQRLAMGADDDWPLEDKLDEIWKITEDPQILGHVLGPFISHDEPNAGELARLGVKTTSIYRMRTRGDLPEPEKLGRTPVWPIATIEAWEKARPGHGWRKGRSEPDQ